MATHLPLNAGKPTPGFRCVGAWPHGPQ